MQVGAALVGLMVAPVGVIVGIAALVGAYIGGKEVARLSGERTRDELLTKLQQVLQDLMRKAQRQANTQFQETVLRFEKEARHLLTEASDSQIAVFQLRLKEIEEARGRGREDNAAKTRELETLVRDLERTQARLAAMVERR